MAHQTPAGSRKHYPGVSFSPTRREIGSEYCALESHFAAFLVVGYRVTRPERRGRLAVFRLLEPGNDPRFVFRTPIAYDAPRIEAAPLYPGND